MDADQFTQLLNSFNAKQAELIQALTNQLQVNNESNQPNDSHSSNPAQNIRPFEPFDSKKEKFKFYLDRFETYLRSKGIQDVKEGDTLDEKTSKTRASILLNSVGLVHYNTLAALVAPLDVKDFKYPELVKALTSMLVPERSMLVSQHYFLNTYQRPNQSIAAYVAELQRDLAECNFTTEYTCECDKTVSVSIAESFLRTQFIRGITDKDIRTKILQSKKTTFKDILEYAISLEASNIDCAELSKQQVSNNQPNPANTSTSNVDKLSTRGNSRRDQTPGRNKTSRNRNNQGQNGEKSRNGSGSRYHSRDRQSRTQSRTRHQKVPYHELGIENLCLRCGRDNHIASDCRCKNLHCDSCNNNGHVSRVCITTLLKKRSQKLNSSRTADQLSVEPHFDNYRITDLYYNYSSILDNPDEDDDKYLASVKIHGKNVDMEVDSGAKYTLLAIDEFRKLNLQTRIQEARIAFRSYSGNITPALGLVHVPVEFNGIKKLLTLYLVPPGHATLLGRGWIRALDIELRELDKTWLPNDRTFSIHSSDISTDTTKIMQQITTEYADIFETKIGCIPDTEVELQLRENATPCFTKERNLPYALRPAVEAELRNMEDQKIYTPCGSCDWASPMVVAPRSNNRIRLCTDYKTGLNERLVNVTYPIRKIPEILDSLRGSRYFCKLDLYNAYLHVKVTEKSAELQAMSTHKGVFKINRLNFGIKTAPAIFNKILAKILAGVPKIELYFDDIVVHGTTLEECTHNLRLCLQALHKNDLHLNKEKCEFFKTSISYLGYVIEYNKIMKSPEKIEAVQKMPRPQNVKEVRSFLGLITYYASFIKNLSQKTAPLRTLLKKDKHFQWTTACEKAFNLLKDEICADTVLIPFDPELPVILTTDAGPEGIAAVLSHQVDGTERPIAYASRSLTEAEKGYSQLDREALAIIFGVTRFYDYLFGIQFTLVTDNEPLTHIFASNRPLPKASSARLLRYANFLTQFNYIVKFKKGSQNQNVDCLSRAAIANTQVHSIDALLSLEIQDIFSEQTFTISNEVVNATTIARETKNDAELGPLLEDLRNNRREHKYTINDGIFFSMNELSFPSHCNPQSYPSSTTRTWESPR